MNTLALELLSHMRWADGLVGDALERDPDAEPKAVQLFAHIAAAEHLWYARIQGVPATVPVWPMLRVAEARELAAEHAELLTEVVRTADEAALGRRVEYRNSAGREFQNTLMDIVTHVAMHGSHHRGQILATLRAAGREPPYVDYIQFRRRDQLG